MSRINRPGERKERKLRSRELPPLGLGQGLEVVAGVAEAHGMSGHDSSVAQGLGQADLAHSGGSRQQGVFPLGRKPQGEGGVQQRVVQSRVIDADQAAGVLETGAFEPGFNAPAGAAVALAADDDFQEGAVAQPLPARSRTAETPL